MQSFPQLQAASRQLGQLFSRHWTLNCTLIRASRLGWLVVCISTACCMEIESAWAQGRTEKKKPGAIQRGGNSKTATAKGANLKSGKGAKGAAEAETEKPLDEIDFGVAHQALLEDGAVKQRDETAAGKKQLKEILAKTKDVFEQRMSVDDERRPLVLTRDRLVGEVVQLNQGIAQLQQGIQQAQIQIRNLNASLSNNNVNAQDVRDQIETIQDKVFLANESILNQQEEITERTPEINALNSQIGPLDAELLKLWAELNECRKQWLEVRNPQEKYAHGNFEALRQSIDEWVLLDSLWPEAFCWAALSNYELGEYQMAWEQVERATELRQVLRLPKPWAQGDALRGLIAAKLPDRRGKASNFLLSANTAVSRDKNSSWVVLFLLGRAACENEKTEAKAKTYFERSLKIRAESPCVKYWLGRLLSIASTETVRDTDAGIKTLEELWQGSPKNSWRLAHQLVLAYDGAKREAEAKATWDLLANLAPKDELENLQNERETIRQKLNSTSTETPKSKAKPGKSSPSATK